MCIYVIGTDQEVAAKEIIDMAKHKYKSLAKNDIQFGFDVCDTYLFKAIIFPGQRHQYANL
jgi:hypothetical protein